MKLLVTGAEGQLGRALRASLGAGYDVIWTDLDELDVRDLAGLRDVLAQAGPDVVIHLAAMTQVDACEQQPERAYEVNALGSRFLALAAREIDAELLMISTDYVFGGGARRPYLEYDDPDPINSYGRSKMHGERAVMMLTPKHYVVRTSGLFAPGGANFVTAIERAGRQKPRIEVVADQVCRPTFAAHLADAVAMLAGSGNYGIYHVASAGETSWAEFARAILAEAGLERVTVAEISSDQLNRPARRPAYSVLDTRAFELTFGHALPSWREGLAQYFANAEGP